MFKTQSNHLTSPFLLLARLPYFVMLACWVTTSHSQGVCFNLPGRSAPLSKNAVSAFQISFKLVAQVFYLERFLKKLADDQLFSSITKGSIYHIKHVHTIFYHSSGLTRNLMFNGSIYYDLYFQILRFYLVRQHCNY